MPSRVHKAAGLTLAAALAWMPAAVLADTTAPPQFQGNYGGRQSQTFGLADASSVNSWECTQSNGVIERPVTLTITETTMTISAMPEVQAFFGQKPYLLPAREQQQFGWANYSPTGSSAQNNNSTSIDGIVMLRPSADPNNPVCFYLGVRNSELVIAILGGASYSWQDQCNSNSYQQIASVSEPFCQTNGQGNAPVRSSVVYRFPNALSTSGANTVSASVAAAGLMAAAAYAANV